MTRKTRGKTPQTEALIAWLQLTLATEQRQLTIQELFEKANKDIHGQNSKEKELLKIYTGNKHLNIAGFKQTTEYANKRYKIGAIEKTKNQANHTTQKSTFEDLLIKTLLELGAIDKKTAVFFENIYIKAEEIFRADDQYAARHNGNFPSLCVLQTYIARIDNIFAEPRPKQRKKLVKHYYYLGLDIPDQTIEQADGNDPPAVPPQTKPVAAVIPPTYRPTDQFWNNTPTDPLSSLVVRFLQKAEGVGVLAKRLKKICQGADLTPILASLQAEGLVQITPTGGLLRSDQPQASSLPTDQQTVLTLIEGLSFPKYFTPSALLAFASLAESSDNQSPPPNPALARRQITDGIQQLVEQNLLKAIPPHKLTITLSISDAAGTLPAISFDTTRTTCYSTTGWTKLWTENGTLPTAAQLEPFILKSLKLPTR
jgi:hypothetical protein